MEQGRDRKTPYHTCQLLESEAKYRPSLKAAKLTVEAVFGATTATEDNWEVDLLASMHKELLCLRRRARRRTILMGRLPTL